MTTVLNDCEKVVPLGFLLFTNDFTIDAQRTARVIIGMHFLVSRYEVLQFCNQCRGNKLSQNRRIVSSLTFPLPNFQIPVSSSQLVEIPAESERGKERQRVNYTYHTRIPCITYEGMKRTIHRCNPYLMCS